MGRFFDFRTARTAWGAPARASDRAAILAMTEEHEGPESAAIAEFWLARQPAAFTAFHTGETREPLGFAAQLILSEPSAEELAADPALVTAWEHVRRHGPLREGEQFSHVRFWMGRDGHQSVRIHVLVAIHTTPLWPRIPRLAWSFTTAADREVWAPIFGFIDFRRAPDADFRVGERDGAAFAHDWRVTPAREWWRLLGRRSATGDADPEWSEPRWAEARQALSHDAFAAAVRDALRAYARPAALARSPLLGSRLVLDAGGDGDALRALLREAVEALDRHPRDEKLARALTLTYLKPAPTQEAAAERLGLPFSTYRRHLTTGLERVVEWLWERELRGATVTT